MPQYKGTHGTTRKRAEGILRDGFELSPEGRAGGGVYFWQYYTNPQIANLLAIGWYGSQVKRKQYGDDDTPCAVLDAAFDVAEQDELDCTEEVLEQVTIMLSKLADRTEDDIGKAYESVIQRIELLRRAPILLVKATVSPPKMSFPVKNVMPFPPILVVRNKAVKIDVSLMTLEE
jgi:hypothetical protein